MTTKTTRPKTIASQVKQLRRKLGRAGAAAALGIHPGSLDRACAGQAIRRGTEALLRAGLEKLASGAQEGAL